eukprot:jgi/Tetstr1/458912/TSEL_000378.t1
MSTGHILPMAALSTHPRLVPLSRLAVAAQPRLRLHPIAAAANAGAHAEAGRSVGEAELAQLWRLGGLSPACPPAVALGDTDNGRGVVVRDGHTVVAGDTLVSVPLETAVVVDEGARGICPDTHLALTLLQQINDESALFHQYVAALPAELHLAWLWSERELRELQSEAVADSARSVRDHVESQYEELPHLPEEYAALGAGVSWEEFRWAMSVVHSRSFAASMPGSGRRLRCIVPIADMFNHGSPRPGGAPQHRWRLAPGPDSSGAGARFVVEAAGGAAAGSELLITYGRKKNADLLVEYGFVEADNSWERGVLYDSAQALVYDDELRAEESLMAAMKKEDVVYSAVPPHHYLAAQPSGQARVVAGLLRVLHADHADLPLLASHFDDEEEGVVFDWNEAAVAAAASPEARRRIAEAEVLVRRQLAARCDELLGDFATTLEEDEQLLAAAEAATEPTSTRWWLALQYRMQAKRTLLAVKDRCRQAASEPPV